MKFSLFSRVVLLCDLRDEGLLAGDMGTVVECHPATSHYPEGYEVEFFAASGETVTVASVPAADLRAATRKDVLHVRELAAA